MLLCRSSDIRRIFVLPVTACLLFTAVSLSEASLIGDTITADATWVNAPLGSTPLLSGATATVDPVLVEFSVPIPTLGGSEFSIDFLADETFTIVFDPADLGVWPIQIEVALTDLDFDPAGSLTGVQQISSSAPGFLDVIDFTADSIDISSSSENAFGASFSATFSYTVEGTALNTPAGTNVVVTPQDQTTVTSPVTLTFDEVTAPGQTTLVTAGTGPSTPTAFRLCDPATYYDLSTTATLAPGSSIEVCIDLSGLSCTAAPPTLQHFEDTTGDGNPDAWVDVTTSSTPTQICGVVDGLSAFAVLVPREKFTFDEGNAEGWTLRGAFRETGGAAVAHNFTFAWEDAVDFPTAIAADPADGLRGAIGFTTPGGHGVPSAGNTWWIMQFYSPDLSGIPEWQGASGFNVEVGENMAASSTLYANLFVVVYDADQQQDRFFFNGTASPIQLDSWSSFSFDWSSSGTFPTNYTIRNVYVNIWGTMNGTYAGGIYLDDVSLIPGPTAVTPSPMTPVIAALDPPSPNPFNPSTTLRFELFRSARVGLDVYDLAGRLVRRLLADVALGSGGHVETWNGCDDEGRVVASGVYVARLRTGEDIQTRRMVLLK